MVKSGGSIIVAEDELCKRFDNWRSKGGSFNSLLDAWDPSCPSRLTIIGNMQDAKVLNHITGNKGDGGSQRYNYIIPPRENVRPRNNVISSGYDFRPLTQCWKSMQTSLNGINAPNALNLSLSNGERMKIQYEIV